MSPLKCFVENWRWSGVPFYLRTGKTLPHRASEVAVQFKDIPQILFNANPQHPQPANVLALRIQPEEGLSLRIVSRVPGHQRANPSGGDGLSSMPKCSAALRPKPMNGCCWT